MGGTPTSKFNYLQLSCLLTIGLGGNTHDEHHLHEWMGGSKQQFEANGGCRIVLLKPCKVLLGRPLEAKAGGPRIHNDLTVGFSRYIVKYEMYILGRKFIHCIYEQHP